MELKKKLALLEDMMELDEGTLCADAMLSDIDEWDSMAKLSLVVLMEDEFSQKITSDQIRALKSVQDILNLMD